MKYVKLIELDQLIDNTPSYAFADGVDLVVIKINDVVSVLYGRCLHRGALLADGHMDGQNLICGVHGWDYRWDTGVSEYNNDEALEKFTTYIEDGHVCVDKDEVADFITAHPQPFDRESYLGLYADTHAESTEPYTNYIKELSKNGLKNYGHHV